MEPFDNAYRGRRVLVTGHTGFKGAWLTEWLLSLGAEVWGCSLPPPTTPALFDQLGLASRLRHHRIADVRDAPAVRASVRECRPEFVFHLAAQPLVISSYADPVETYAINVMGTINLLEALRDLADPCAAVFVTSDKCYENQNRPGGYGEGDPLGGSDPYSSSKAAAEIAIASWRRSFFSMDGEGGHGTVGIASVRAGNVIGGGDWAAHRIVPDCIRSLMRGEPIPVRNPGAIRPWQHVLEPLSGYLLLGARLRSALTAASTDGTDLRQLCSAFNFGPRREDERPVRELVDEVLKHWPGRWIEKAEAAPPVEAQRLHLRNDKAATILGWRPGWSFAEAVARTVEWYRASADSRTDIPALTRKQIGEFSRVK
jgi:CDP-glucose 4,6-dehydratase